MESFAPVVVFAYSRVDHLKITLETLNESPLAAKTDIFVFCDNYRKENDKEAVQAVRNYVDHFVDISMFKSISVRKAETNQGLKNSVISGVSEIIEKYGKVIVVEDDLKTSHHFLRYMNDALNYYESNPRIWAISGYSFPMEALKKYKYDVFFTGRGCSWGWASWRNRWNKIDWNVSSYSQFKHDWKKRIAFSQWGADLPPMLDGQMACNINSWAVIWCYEAYRNSMLTVYPSKSHVLNLGNDGTGTHGSVSEDTYATELENSKQYKCDFVEPFIDKSIKREFSKKYSGNPTYFIKDQVKSFLRRNGLYRK